MNVDWGNFDSLAKQARHAYYDNDWVHFNALNHLLKLWLDDVNRSLKSSAVHSTGFAEVQAEAIREDRRTDRPGDPSRLYATGQATR